MSAPRIAFLVTHLMGSGHLARVQAIAAALRARGARACVISGGRPLAQMPLGADDVQLPPLTADGLDYGRMLDDAGHAADAAYMGRRTGMIRAALGAVAPHVLVTELFPFGRRALAAEFEAAAAARPAGCALACSVRDIPEPPRKDKRIAEAAARLSAWDAVLVHGDPAVLPFSHGWPGMGRETPAGVAEKLRHTGYVVTPPAPPSPGEGAGEILVSVGAGVIGRRLLELAAPAARGHPLRWRLLVGGGDAAAEAARLNAMGPALAEPARPDFRAMLPRAALSISLAGYNTAVEAALRGGPSLLVPMEEGGEQEQLIRARAFAALPGVTMLRIGDLTPQTLRAAADAALAAAPATPPALRADGAARAAEMLFTLAGA